MLAQFRADQAATKEKIAATEARTASVLKDIHANVATLSEVMTSVNKLAESTNDKFNVLTASMERLSNLMDRMANNQRPKQDTNASATATAAEAAN